MNSKQVLATFVVAILVASTATFAGITSLRVVSAQSDNVTIATSADAHGRTFFGEGVLRVVVTDDEADDDDNQETITVDIDGNPDSGSDGSDTFTIPETSQSSGKFEFYLMHVDADDVALGDIDTINTNNAAFYADVVFDGEDMEAPVIRFGPAADGADLAIEGAEDLFESVAFDITAGDTEVSVDYDEMAANLTLDRESFGSTSVVHLFINDQDANQNPTASDDLLIVEADLDDLFNLEGATFVDDVTFEETGDNTAMFEGIVQLTTADSATEEELVWTSETVQVTLNDMANYLETGTGFTNAENDSTDTSDVSFEIDDTDGELSGEENITFGTELNVSIVDNDQNRDSDDDDTITDGLVITTDSDTETVDLEETGDNTGIFVPDTTNNEIKITFVNDVDDVIPEDNIIQLGPGETSGDIVFTYFDPLNDDSEEEEFEFTTELTLTRPVVTLPETAGVNDDFIVTINSPQLNDNPRTKDSYSFDLTGDGPEFDLERGGVSIGEFVTIEVEIEGDNPTFDDLLTYTLTETGANTGIFTAKLDMAAILESTGIGVDDGDQIEIIFNDRFDDQSREASDSLAIGKETTDIDFSRTALPIPPVSDGDVAEILGDTVFTTLTITDSDENEQSATEDSIPFVFEDDAAAGEPSFTVEVDGNGDDFDETITSAAEYDGSFLEEITEGALDGLILKETTKTSGIFDEDIGFVDTTDIDSDEWQDLEIIFTYIDADGDEQSTGITFRGNDGTVTVDKVSVKSGDVATIEVQDEDLNLDGTTEEEFEGTVGTDGDFILSVETEDDEIAGTRTVTFRETGEDTGIFVAEYTVGDDIPVTDEAGDDEIEQATNILVTYNDEIDSTGSSGDELEVNVPVVTSTAVMIITPTLVGPGTEITVQIVDADLDKDPKGTETYDPGALADTDDYFVNFTSDRDEVGDGSPELEETGPNTGVFEFQLELVTDETACENDDLDEPRFDADGGNEPSIGACPGDFISIEYEDEQNAEGVKKKISAVVEVKSWDPEFVLETQNPQIGERATIVINDPDANHDPDIADSLADIRVFSDSDLVGEEISAIETGKNTGVFKMNFRLTSGTESGAISVDTGDEVTIEYTDAFPADFEEEEDDKDFTFVFTVGKPASDPTAISPSNPILRDFQGEELDEVTAGQQVVLSTTLTNTKSTPQVFAAIVEVRDADGFTVYLQWQTGSLAGNAKTNVGLSWTPDAPGTYTVRTFALDSISGAPAVLSPVAESTVTVS